MALQRRHYVVDIHLLAVVEGNTLADLERPALRVVRSVPRFGEHRNRPAVRRRGLDQGFAPAADKAVWHLAAELSGVQAVRRRAAEHGELQVAALLRGLRPSACCKELRSDRQRYAERRGVGEKVAAAKRAIGALPGRAL